MLNDCPLSTTKSKTFKVTIVNNYVFITIQSVYPSQDEKQKERTELNLKTEVDKKEGILLKVQRTSANLVHHSGHGYVNIVRGEEFNYSATDEGIWM